MSRHRSDGINPNPSVRAYSLNVMPCNLNVIDHNASVMPCNASVMPCNLNVIDHNASVMAGNASVIYCMDDSIVAMGLELGILDLNTLLKTDSD